MPIGRGHLSARVCFRHQPFYRCCSPPAPHHVGAHAAIWAARRSLLRNSILSLPFPSSHHKSSYIGESLSLCACVSSRMVRTCTSLPPLLISLSTSLHEITTHPLLPPAPAALKHASPHTYLHERLHCISLCPVVMCVLCAVDAFLSHARARSSRRTGKVKHREHRLLP